MLMIDSIVCSCVYFSILCTFKCYDDFTLSFKIRKEVLYNELVIT